MSRIEKQVARSAGKPTAREAWDEALRARANTERLTKILGVLVEREGGMLVLDVEDINRINAREIQFNRAPDGKSMLVSSPAFLRARAEREAAQLALPIEPEQTAIVPVAPLSRWERFRARLVAWFRQLPGGRDARVGGG